jgi:hypothetical protein
LVCLELFSAPEKQKFVNLELSRDKILQPEPRPVLNKNVKQPNAEEKEQMRNHRKCQGSETNHRQLHSFREGHLL